MSTSFQGAKWPWAGDLAPLWFRPTSVNWIKVLLIGTPASELVVKGNNSGTC